MKELRKEVAYFKILKIVSVNGKSCQVNDKQLAPPHVPSGFGIQGGFPVYLIATNAHLAGAIRNKCTTLESLKLVKGFGKRKIEKYVKGLTAIIKTFYQGS